MAGVSVREWDVEEDPRLREGPGTRRDSSHPPPASPHPEQAAWM